MISACIFSKNRPMQLDACLKSMAENAHYIDDVSVLYTYDDEKFAEPYERLRSQYNYVSWMQERPGDSREDWKKQITFMVSSFHQYFLWGTDDSIFYRPTELTQEKLDWAFRFMGAKSINLRVGLNIKWQNHWHTTKTPPIPEYSVFEDLISWDATNMSVQNDIGRVWQNDASIMPRDEYLDRLKVEPNWWKGKGCRALDNVGQCGNIFNPRIAAAFEESTYLNIPVNLVHLLDDGRLHADNWGKTIRQDIHMLHDRFMDGQRINWKAIDVSDIDCGRKEVEYIYE